MPDELITVNASQRNGDDKLLVYRKVPRTGRVSDPFYVSFSVPRFIRTLADPPERDARTGKIKGLGLTYGQVVSVLHRMCEAGHINARFILQEYPEARVAAPTALRPDVPAPGDADLEGP
jgi:hypothetical protein